MEGLAVGVMSEAKEVAVLALSIIIHKIPVGFSVGATFAKNK